MRSDLVLPLPIWRCNSNNNSNNNNNNSSNYRTSAPELHRQPVEVAAVVEAAGHHPLHQRRRTLNHLRLECNNTCQERRLRISLRLA